MREAAKRANCHAEPCPAKHLLFTPMSQKAGPSPDSAQGDNEAFLSCRELFSSLIAVGLCERAGRDYLLDRVFDIEIDAKLRAGIGDPVAILIHEQV